MGRQENLGKLKNGSDFDLVIIGGGATGCGVALDAATRGLKVALVEKNDFAEGTSSRSTKLVHGGVRYLEMAVKKLDKVQYNLVKDGLRERSILLSNARHLANRLPLVTPLYRWIDIPYIFAGLKLYDILSGKRNIGHSRLLSRKEALRRYPHLKPEGLKAGVLYYDGQFHDARMALYLALTAEKHGATVVNHVAVTGFLKQDGKICGVALKDSLTGEAWQLNAKGVVNAAGPFVDQIRMLDDPNANKIISASTGIHIILDKRFAPPETGLMIPETEDGRVLFVLPWEGYALVGTTDEPADICEHPKPLATEIDYLLRHVTRYFNLEVEKADIKAAWSGLRPLVSDPKAADTAKLARDHVIEESTSSLLTIAGGKWTTYRKMASDTVDHALQQFQLSAANPVCQTENLRILGSENCMEQAEEMLQKEYILSAEVASHLCRTYGDQAAKVAQLATQGFDQLLIENLPVLEAEVVFAIRNEMAVRAIDVLARRLSLALVDTKATKQAAPKVLKIMEQELNWSRERYQEEEELLMRRLTEAL